MYFRGEAEETRDIKDMKVWFCVKMDKHIKKASHNPCSLFIGHNL